MVKNTTLDLNFFKAAKILRFGICKKKKKKFCWVILDQAWLYFNFVLHRERWEDIT